MEHTDFARVSDLMARMAAGDGAAVFDLQREFAPQLAAAVRRALRSRGVELARPEIDDLAADVTLELHDVAAAWRPEGGALPWVWAAHRVNNVIDRHLGLFTESLDDGRPERLERLERMAASASSSPGTGAGDEPPAFALLERVAACQPLARLLCDALRAVAGARDRELVLEMAVQTFMGDRAPAATVAPRFGLSPESARQQKRRVTRRLAVLVAADERFAPLARTSLVA